MAYAHPSIPQTPQSPPAPHHSGATDIAFGKSENLDTLNHSFRRSIIAAMRSATDTSLLPSRVTAHGSRRQHAVNIYYPSDFHRLP